jgi:tRNA 2-thiouridine synthesizing protein A
LDKQNWWGILQETYSNCAHMTSKSDKQLVADTIDATGLKCPEPVMMLRNALRRVDAGTCLKLVATDPSTLRDIPTMCRFMHHELVSQDELDGRYEFVVSARALSPQD